MAESTKPPKVFISYAWEDDVKPWVRAFAKRLRKDGVETVLDLWETDYGDQLPEFMEKAVRESDFVVLICTPKYKRKSDGREGGVGYEGHIITAEIFETSNHRKFIPVLRKGAWGSASPSWAAGKLYIDLSGIPYDEDNYRDLLRTLHGKKPTPPPVGKPPEFPDEDDERPKKSKPRDPRKPLVSKDDADKFIASLRSFARKLIPLLRVIGVLIISGALFWVGSWAVPEFISLIPTPKATSTQRPTAQITFTNSPIVPTKTNKPTSTPVRTPTKIRTPTFVPSSNITATNFCGENIYVFKKAGNLNTNLIEDAYIPPDATFNLSGLVSRGSVRLQNFITGGFFLETTGPFNSSTYSGAGWAFLRYDNSQCVRFLQGTNTVVLNRETVQFEIANNATPTP